MGEEGSLNLSPVISQDKSESFCSMLFGVSCAVFALKHLQEPEKADPKWLEISNRLLKGSAHLLGLLMWRVQKTETRNENREIFHKLRNAEKGIEELKRKRREDAKANEKVAGIYASQEQCWFLERRKMRQQIRALLNELRVSQTRRDETVNELKEKLELKGKVLEQEEGKRREMEEKLQESEKVLEELRENIKREAQERNSELWKHKTAFIELVSNQRQLEAEMGRALKQAEASKQELTFAFEQKEEAVLMTRNLSLELVKTRKDLDQKEKILSAILRKLKLDTAEKQMLLKELNVSKTKRKQAELEREVSETRRERYSFKSMLSRHTSFKFRSNIEEEAQSRSRSVPSEFLLEYDQTEHENELQVSSQIYDQYSVEGIDELIYGTDVKQLENWVRFEAEKYSTLVEQRHHLEINAFSEQMRLKDEKLEGLQWRLLSMELESKRIRTHVEVLNHTISQIKQENTTLNSSLLEKEAEINSLKHQLALNLESQNQQEDNLSIVSQNIWSNVEIIKTNASEKEEEEQQQEQKITCISQSKDIIILSAQSPENEFEEEKDVELDPGSIQDIIQIVENPQISSKKNVVPCKMDIHALGITYKIKRLKQQLLMLEKFTGKQKKDECSEGDDCAKIGTKGFHLLIALLSKQVSRYQSLQEKTDELCKRMHENELESSPGDFRIAKSKNDTKALANYLEETFQLQRYIVASGQKLMELQSKIVSGFIEAAERLDGPGSRDMKRCGDNVGTIFKEVQRGLEIRIARIIGDVEGTLACDGIIHLRK